MRILVAEDDRALRSVLVEGLQEFGYQVDAAADGEEAIEQLRFYGYDVAIVDWRMPRVSGLEVVTWARRHDKQTAMIMLTARDTVRDRIEGLDGGADDYLVKPFDFGELVARVRALQRRPRAVEGPVLRRGALELDPVRREVRREGHPLNLTATEYLILEVLLRRSPGLVTRQAIAEHAWQDETAPLGSNTIDVQISRIRAKLGDAGVSIVTIRGTGYRLEPA